MPEINGRKGGADAEGAKQCRGFLLHNWSRIFVPTHFSCCDLYSWGKNLFLEEAVVPSLPVTVQNQARKHELSHISEVCFPSIDLNT